MSEPWFQNPDLFAAYFGGIGGGIGGSLLGLFGAISGYLLQLCIGKKFVIGGLIFFIVLGLCNLITGLVAYLQDQPYAIFLPFLIIGTVFTLIPGSLIPIFIHLYKIKKKRLQAAEEESKGKSEEFE